MTFDRTITHQARQQPHSLAVITFDASLSFAEFDLAIDRVAHALRAGGLPNPADDAGAIAIDVRDAYLHWLVLLALARLGLATTVAENTSASYRVSDDVLPTGAAGQTISGQWLNQALQATADPLPRTAVAPDAIARVQLSSGTVGAPKRIGYSWALVNACMRGGLLSYSVRQGGLATSLVGTGTIMGLLLPLAAWAAGSAVILGVNALRLPGLLTRLRPDVVGLNPGLLQAMLDTLPAGFQPLPGLRIVSAGSAVTPALAQRTRLSLAPELRLLYGTTECTSIAMANAAWLDATPGIAGYPMPDVVVEVVDENDRPLPPGNQGEVRTRSDRMIGGYLDDPHASARMFRGGWFYPGDVGRMRADGLLVLDGRVDEKLNLGGQKILPSEIESRMQTCPGVADIAAFSVPGRDGVQQAWLAIVRGAGFDLATFERHALAQLAHLPSVQITYIDALPRNAMHKIERLRLRQMVQAAQRGQSAT